MSHEGNIRKKKKRLHQRTTDLNDGYDSDWDWVMRQKD